MRKRLLLIMLAGMMLLSACGSSDSDSSSDKSSKKSNKAKVEADFDDDDYDDDDDDWDDDWDDEEDETADLEEIKLLDSGYALYSNDYSSYLFYAVEVENPNEEYAIHFPEATITVKDADGKIITTEDEYLPSIAAGETYKYGDNIYLDDDVKGDITVEISVANDEYAYEKQEDSEIVPSKDLEVSNVSENEDSYTGEVTNSSDLDLDLEVSVIFTKDGKLVGGEKTYVTNVDAGDTKAFEVLAYSEFADYDGYEVAAFAD